MLPSAPLRSQGAADAVPTHAGPRAAKAEAATLAALPIDVIYADDEFLVVDKPPDVRMAGDEFEVTLQKVLEARYWHSPATTPAAETPSASSTSAQPRHNAGHNAALPRLQHVHRLDYATSGVCCWGKRALTTAAAQLLFQARYTRKEYTAVVAGHVSRATLPSDMAGVTVLADDDGRSVDDVAASLAVAEEDEEEEADDGPSTGARADSPASAITPSGGAPRAGARNHRLDLSSLREPARDRKGRRKGEAGLPPPPPTARHWYERMQQRMVREHTSGGTPPPPALLQLCGSSDVKPLSWYELKEAAKAQRRPGEKARAVVDFLQPQGVGYDPATEAFTLGPDGVPVLAIPSSSEVDSWMDWVGRWAVHAMDAATAAEAAATARYRRAMAAAKASASAAKEPAGFKEGCTSGTMVVAPVGLCLAANGAAVLESVPPALPRVVIELPVVSISRDEFRMALGPSTRLADGGARSAATILCVEAYGWLVHEGTQFPVTLVRLRPLSGRRHQLRLHTAVLGHPIVGDITYGLPLAHAAAGVSVTTSAAVPTVHEAASRMMLHAAALGLDFPRLWEPGAPQFRGRRWLTTPAAEAVDCKDKEGENSRRNGVPVLRAMSFQARDPFHDLPELVWMEPPPVEVLAIGRDYPAQDENSRNTRTQALIEPVV